MNKPAVLAVASYFKGNRFLEQVQAGRVSDVPAHRREGLTEPWARHALDDVFAVPDFHNRRNLTNAVAYLWRTQRFDRIVALDDFDIEVARSSANTSDGPTPVTATVRPGCSATSWRCE
ncbi:MAG: hypothetical protein U0871_05060 [Gemmataceae bacterium]